MDPQNLSQIAVGRSKVRNGGNQKLHVASLGTAQSLCQVTLGQEVTHHRDDRRVIAQPY